MKMSWVKFVENGHLGNYHIQKGSNELLNGLKMSSWKCCDTNACSNADLEMFLHSFSPVARLLALRAYSLENVCNAIVFDAAKIWINLHRIFIAPSRDQKRLQLCKKSLKFIEFCIRTCTYVENILGIDGRDVEWRQNSHWVVWMQNTYSMYVYLVWK